MSGWVGIVAVVVGGEIAEIVVGDVRIVEVVVGVVVDIAAAVEPQAARDTTKAKNAVMS